MNRKDKIKFLIGLKKGTRTISELVHDNSPHVHIFVEREPGGLFCGKGGTFTKDEIEKIFKPSLKATSNSHIQTIVYIRRRQPPNYPSCFVVVSAADEL